MTGRVELHVLGRRHGGDGVVGGILQMLHALRGEGGLLSVCRAAADAELRPAVWIEGLLGEVV